MKRLLLAAFALPTLLCAQRPTRADSALVGRILLAEDRRDSTAAALADGEASSNTAIQLIARRARARIRDPRFAARDSMLPVPPSRSWAEPAWRLRYRALATRRDDCGALRAALQDSAWPVRLRAMDLATPACARDDSLAASLHRWIATLPADASRRSSGGVSWHAAAHALVALARLRPEEARPRVTATAGHRQWQVRMYAARAAAILADTARLRAFARDPDGNVAEAAIDALARLTGHADDAIYRTALRGTQPQAVRAAAIALKGSPDRAAAADASAVYARWVARGNASEKDARVALLEAAGRSATEDKTPPSPVTLPARAVALALGEEVQLRVTMSPASGGGSYLVRLRGDVAPIMAARVLELVRSGYYDGGNWHRVEADFVIQGGGPGSNEYVGHSRFLRDELATIPHPRGSIGMSTRGHDTGDAQWFVNLKDNPRLVRDYTVFAEVIEGMDVVDGILEGDRIATIREVTAK